MKIMIVLVSILIKTDGILKFIFLIIEIAMYLKLREIIIGGLKNIILTLFKKNMLNIEVEYF